MTFSGSILGYDPGGNNSHGVAHCKFEAGVPTSIEIKTCFSAEEVLEFAASISDLRVVGVDTLTAWSTSKSGWRPADLYLRNLYKPIIHSITSPNSLAGSMGINGMAVLVDLKLSAPQITVSETHPKVLYYALTKEKYDYVHNSAAMDSRLSDWLGIGVTTKNDHEWDAAVSALAAYRGITGQWLDDLHQKQLESNGRLIWPCGKTFYWWPNAATS